MNRAIISSKNLHQSYRFLGNGWPWILGYFSRTKYFGFILLTRSVFLLRHYWLGIERTFFNEPQIHRCFCNSDRNEDSEKCPCDEVSSIFDYLEINDKKILPISRLSFGPLKDSTVESVKIGKLICHGKRKYLELRQY